MAFYISIFFIITLFFVFISVYGLVLRKTLPVLMYHSISKQSISDLTVLEDELEKHFIYLNKNNFESIFYDEIDSNRKQVMITFDDGYVNNKEMLLPLLKKYQIKATIFIPFKYIGKMDEWWTNSQPIMSYDDLKEINSEYVRFGWHSYSHESYRKLSIEEIELDLNRSNAVILEYNLKVQPVFAFPFGAFSKDKLKREKTVELLKKFNIKMALRIGNKLNKLPISDMYLVKRIDIKGTDSYKKFIWKLYFGRIKPF